MKNIQLFDLFWEDILVTQVLPNLTLRECFNFRCVSKTCLQIINMYFAKLKSLKLMNKGFSPPSFNVLAMTCNRLTVLNLSRCTSITDDDLIPMLMSNRNLINLNLSQCKNLSAKCLQPVILYCNKLQTLKLARCAWLTTGAVEALALHQCLLEDVDLSYCVTVSENCILIFVKKFCHLKTLNLEGNKQVSDMCLYALAKHSTSLKLLNLSGCTDISDKGVKALATHSPKLEGLVVRGCTKVTENSLKLMRNRVHVDRRPVDTGPVPIYVQLNSKWQVRVEPHYTSACSRNQRASIGDSHRSANARKIVLGLSRVRRVIEAHRLRIMAAKLSVAAAPNIAEAQ